MEEMTAVVEKAKRQLAGITGLKPLTISGITHGEGQWCLHVDVLEMARIPPATDLIGEYEVSVDEEGQMLRFARKRSRLRGEPLTEDRGT